MWRKFIQEQVKGFLSLDVILPTLRKSIKKLLVKIFFARKNACSCFEIQE